MKPLFNYTNIIRAGQIDIKSVRLKAGLTQKELAQIIGVTKQTIINYEKGTTEPTWERLEEIALALNSDIEDFSHIMKWDKQKVILLGQNIWID